MSDIKDSVRTGMELLEEGKLKEAEEILRQAADAGDAEACRILAREYRHKFHFSDEGDSEIHYTQLAAEKGSLIDRCFMALFAASGMDTKIKKDRIQAAAWLEPVKDHPAAKAICQLFGLSGCKRDKAAALVFFRGLVDELYGQPDEADWLSMFSAIMGFLFFGISPDQDSPLDYFINDIFMAGFRLSGLHSTSGYLMMGTFLTTDSGDDLAPEQQKEIVALLEKGVARNDYDCMHCLGLYLLKHDQAERGRNLIRKAAEQGLPEAQFKLYLCCSSTGDLGNVLEGLKWLEKAIKQGYVEALYSFGLTCNSRNVEDPDAVKYFRKAAKKGHAKAQYELATCYYNGSGARKKPAKAWMWYCKAAEQGMPEAQLKLGICYFSGIGVKRDCAEAVKWYRKAAEQEYAEAQFNLGFCYDFGIGIEKNRAEAVK